MKRCAFLILGVIFSVIVVIQQAPVSHALSLKMQPLIYRDTLNRGESKKGFIDVSNPTGQTLHLQTSVQGFRQVNDEGALQFFDNEQIAAGIQADLHDFELGPRQAIRLYFLIDGNKLPPGDVFGALFVSTVPNEKSSAATSVRLGTLFVLTNGTPGSRQANITNLDVGFWQFGSSVSGSFAVKNLAQSGTATGFFPIVKLAIDPFHSQQDVHSKLVFAGRSRQTDFRFDSARFGLYKISASYGSSKQEKWVFMMTGYWRGVVIAGAALIAAGAITWWAIYYRRRK